LRRPSIGVGSRVARTFANSEACTPLPPSTGAHAIASPPRSARKDDNQHTRDEGAFALIDFSRFR